MREGGHSWRAGLCFHCLVIVDSSVDEMIIPVWVIKPLVRVFTKCLEPLVSVSTKCLEALVSVSTKSLKPLVSVSHGFNSTSVTDSIWQKSFEHATAFGVV